GEGRPTLRVGSGSRSTTRPCAASVETSPPTVERLRPVACVSAARESGPSWWARRRIAPRLARRTPSTLAPFAAIAPSPFRVVFCPRSEEHTSELQSRENLVCRLLLEKKK